MRDRVEELVNKITTEDKTNELKNKRLNLSLRNNDIKMKKVPGLNLTELLPFVATTESKHTIQQLGKNLIDSNRLDADFMCLFASQNLQFVHNYFFGACGAKEDNLSTHSVQNSLFWSFKGPERALETYMVNFENMWDDKKRSYKLLDKVVLKLLRHHIARNRESKCISTTTTRKPPGKKDIRHHARYVCRAKG
ncbi:hypothetical protein F4703DRAFT_1960349 [Phycomyces blakesleeanus]